MNILCLGDEWSGLKLATDSSIEISKAFIKRNSKVWWAVSSELYLINNVLIISATELDAKNEEISISDKLENLPVTFFDLILIRKDPPVNQDYLRMCWLLASLEKNIVMLNRPSSLLRYHEKLLPLEMVKEGVLLESEILPLSTSRRKDQASKWYESRLNKEAIAKPFFGHGGRDIQKFQTQDELLKINYEEELILQDFVSEVTTDGDLRIFTVGCQVYEGYARVPVAGHHVSNIARGGKAVVRPLSDKEHDLCKRVAGWLSDHGIVFSGLDMIGGRLSEINITSPTGLATRRHLLGDSVANLLVDYVMKECL